MTTSSKPLNHSVYSIVCTLFVFFFVLALPGIPVHGQQTANQVIQYDLPNHQDTDKDGIPNSIEQQCKTIICDHDDDGVEDYLDEDSDRDGVLDMNEKGESCSSLDSCTPQDSNGDTIQDYREKKESRVVQKGIIEGILITVVILSILSIYAIMRDNPNAR